MDYVWSDLHFNHENIIRYEPMRSSAFTSIEHMNKVLKQNWRETIKGNDRLFNLGDFAWKGNKSSIEKIVKNLPGYKILVMGNHDRGKSVNWWREVGFDEVYPCPIIYKRWFMLSHEPLYVTANAPYVNIHGHTHGESSDNIQKVNVSVECTNFKPVLLDSIMDRFKIPEIE